MPGNVGTLETIATLFGKIFQPLLEELKPIRAKAFFAQIGIPLTGAQVSSLAAPLGNLVTAVSALITIVTDLLAAIAQENLGAVAQKGILAIAKIKDIIDSLPAVATGLKFAGVSAAVADKVPGRIFDFLLASQLEGAPGINAVLELFGLLDREDFNQDSEDPEDPPYSIFTYHLSAIGDWLSDPSAKMASLFEWGSAGFDGKKLFARLEKVAAHAHLPVLYLETPTPKLDILILEAVPTTGLTPKGLLIKLKNSISTGDQTFRQGDVTVTFKADFQIPEETGLTLQPNGNLNFKPPTATALNGDFEIGLKVKREAGGPFVLFGQTDGSRFEIGEVGFKLGTGVAWDGIKANGEFSFEAAIKDGKVVIDTSSGDGFLTKILPAMNMESTFDLMAGVSTERGFYLQGSSALELRLPTHIEIGPVTLEALTIGLKLKDGKIPLSLGADIKAELGPMVAVVQNMGVTATFSFPPGNGGNLGPLQMDIGFKPPDGVGLSIDTGVIKGGGFLRLDFDKGEYFGALELSFQGIIALKAIGIINTKMPDGSQGFALLILITAEFTPIQLGFGFTLNGVGGLLGVNRTADVEALKAGVKTGAVSSILFPQDVVANISRIISDLKSIFPIAEDHFLIGPMAKLGWGTPTLITLELGIIIDIPVPRLIILGVLRCILPTKEAAILKLQVNFAGGIDFDQGLIWFDASLFDSQILTFTLTGDMALRIGWKDPVFIVSVGGFHPAFKEIPPDLTGMRRIMLSLMSGDNPRLTAQIYFAVTSNSVQSGAKVELYAEACGFNLYGYLGYDLLVQFSPFHFIADIYAGLALRSGTDEIAGVHVHCTLSGPTPWHADGEASLTILFFEISVGFDVTWGELGPSQPEEIEDVLALVKAALEDKRNWKADLPAHTNQSVSLRKLELAEDDIIIHPFGILAVSQKVVPLGLPIDKFGNKKPGADTRFDLTYGGGATEEVKEEFAMANFIRMTDSEKVARKSFEKIRSGLRLTPEDATNHGFEIQKEVNYELSYVHRKRGLTIKAGLFKLFTGMFTTLSKGGSIANNAYSASRKAATCAPAKVDHPGEKYLVVNTSDLALHAPGMTAASEAEAYALYASAIRGNPALQGAIQVVSAFEVH